MPEGEDTIGMRNEWLLATVLSVLIHVAGPTDATGSQLGKRPAGEWIETLHRPARVEGLRIDEIIATGGLKPGDVMADIGAGAGTLTVPFARAASTGGHVHAVDVDHGPVDHIAERARAEAATNVKPVLGEFADPGLPAQDIDIAFFHDVLHHVEHGAGCPENLARYIKPDGRIVVIEGYGQNMTPAEHEYAHDPARVTHDAGADDRVDGRSGLPTLRGA